MSSTSVLDPEDARALGDFRLPPARQRPSRLLEMADVAVGHGDELHLVPGRRPQRRHPARLQLRIVRVRAEGNDAERLLGHRGSRYRTVNGRTGQTQQHHTNQSLHCPLLEAVILHPPGARPHEGVAGAVRGPYATLWPMPDIESGLVTALFLFDVAETIRLDQVRAAAGHAARDTRLTTKMTSPVYVQYKPPPIAIRGDAIGVPDTQGFATAFKVYEYGVISVALTLDFRGSWQEFLRFNAGVMSSDQLEIGARQACTSSSTRSAMRPSDCARRICRRTTSHSACSG